jgi:hypothetical protein
MCKNRLSAGINNPESFEIVKYQFVSLENANIYCDDFNLLIIFIPIFQTKGSRLITIPG